MLNEDIMKVLFIADANSIHTIRWVNALEKDKNEVVLVSLGIEKKEDRKLNKAIKVVYLPITGNKGYYLNALSLKKIYFKEKPDIVNVHYASGYGTLARIARIPNIILSVWGSDVYDFPYENLVKMHIIKKNLRYAFQLASTSDIMAEQVRRLLKENIDITITPFGVDCTKFCPKVKKKQTVFSYGIVKTLTFKYGIDCLIKAFAITVRKIEEAEGIEKQVFLDIYGEGELLEELQNLSSELHVKERVIFHGFISNAEVPSALNELDVFCCSSRCESFGVSVVEAMACGLPVIATDVDGFEEVVEPNLTGYIVKKDDAEEMSKYMVQLYYDKALRMEMGKKGRKRVEKLYDWEDNVKTMIELYQENIKAKKRKAI